jgi:hypothetical protein
MNERGPIQSATTRSFISPPYRPFWSVHTGAQQMPNCFLLTKNGSKDASYLTDVDEELCVMLNEPVDPERFVASWYDTIGFMLACGYELEGDKMEEFLQNMQSERLNKIAAYLRQNYTVDSWAER